jgi:predicted RNase H-like HicB family nuclease
MPKTGYWVECIPLPRDDVPEFKHELKALLYTAQTASFPGIKAVGGTPDEAIERLRQKLQVVKRYHRLKGTNLPEPENPVRPPQRFRGVRGWMSIYLELAENTSQSRH